MVLLVVTSVLSIAGTVYAAGNTSTITVGTSPTGIAYDSAKGEIFVANSGYNTVSVISDSSNSVSKTVTVGISPKEWPMILGKGEIFVTNHGSNSVSIISDSNNSSG